MSGPKVTVLIPFFNSKKYLSLAIQSVFDQTYEKWKLILIDDASTDDYLPSIKKFLKDKRVVLIKNVNNQGQSKSLNKGFKIVDTPYVVQLDSDDLFFPNTLEVLMKEAKKQKSKIGLICGNMKINIENQEGEILRSKIRKGGSFEDPYKFILANKSLCPRLYRTSALRSIGGWPTDDPYEGRFREDMRTMYRLIEKYKFHWIDKELYIVRLHNNNHTKQLDKYNEMMKWSVENALQRLGDKYEPVYVEVEDGWQVVSSLKPKKRGGY